MNAQTLKALKDAIKHWVRLRDRVSKEEPGADNCPLCTLFLCEDTLSIKCRKCPVYKSTGKVGCLDTPYQVAADSIWLLGDNVRKINCQKEIDFLKSLLPKDTE